MSKAKFDEAPADRGPTGIGRLPEPWLRLTVQFASLSMLGALLFVFHGLSLHLTPWSQAIINGIVKYRYDPQGEYGQKDATVVIFREENLRTLGTSFPVPYEVHAVILKELSNHRPRAVFVPFRGDIHVDHHGNRTVRIDTEGWFIQNNC